MESQFSVVNEDEETSGFNIDCGETWVYPTNIPLRDYQFKIINEALFKNTMVCLPTGLGKTFIAAVVMYNFYRWYPHGKIIFMAPTKPLVKQQVDACYNIVAIPKDVTAELTGNTAQNNRNDIWEEKRVFFITPQVLQNDLERIAALAKNIKCLVFDEAHRARGNHAYCEVIRKIFPISKCFRVLALSATPGSTVTDVVKVCNTLLISHLEMRTEESSDVVPYIHKRTIETIVVQLDGKLLQIRDDFIKILDKYVRVLVQHKVVHGNCSMLTKGKIFFARKEFEEKERHNRRPAYNEIMKTLNICLILYHGFEVLIKHGLRGFLLYFEDHHEKPLIKSITQIKIIMEDIRQHLGPIPIVDTLPDGTIPDIPETTKFGHPKFYKLADILLKHYKAHGQSSKVIVFCEYRESVLEAYTILLLHKSLIKPKIFLGQGVITQRQQTAIIESFRSGSCNTLVSTSIGEEGLDIGEVDLVVCFDISNKSSIRMVQRMGRTGRKRDGKVVMLVTEGKEQQLLQDSLAHKDYMTNTILNSKELANNLYKDSPRMIPKNVNPTCLKMHLTITKPKQKLKNNNLKSMFDNMSQAYRADVELIDFVDRIPASKYNFNLSISKNNIDTVSFEKCQGKLQAQRCLQSTQGEICSSADSQLLVSLLKFSDSKRYNIPFFEKTSLNNNTAKTNGFKQSDIRTMFLRQTLHNTQAIDEIESTENCTNKQFQKEINDYLSIINFQNYECKICDNLFSCTVPSIKCDTFKVDIWVPPDNSVLNSLTLINLKSFSKLVVDPADLNPLDCDEFDEVFENLDVDEQIEKIINNDNIIKTALNNEHVNDINEVDINYQINVVESKCSSSLKSFKEDDCQKDVTLNASHLEKVNEENKYYSEPPTRIVKCVMPKTAEKILQAYNCHESIADEFHVNDNKVDSDSVVESLCKLYKPVLNFFKLNDINDLFNETEVPNVDLDDTILMSPYQTVQISDDSRSPILSSYSQAIVKKSKAHKRLFSQIENTEKVWNSSASKMKSCPTNTENNTNKENPKITLEDEDIFDDDVLDILKPSSSQKHVNISTPVQSEKRRKILDHSSPDLFDSKSSENIQEMLSLSGQNNLNDTINKLTLNDICDISILDLIENPRENKICSSKASLQLNINMKSNSPKKVAKKSMDLLDMCDASILDLFENKTQCEIESPKNISSGTKGEIFEIPSPNNTNNKTKNNILPEKEISYDDNIFNVTSNKTQCEIESPKNISSSTKSEILEIPSPNNINNKTKNNILPEKEISYDDSKFNVNSNKENVLNISRLALLNQHNIDSDDDFQKTPARKGVNIQISSAKTSVVDSDDDFETSIKSNSSVKSKTPHSIKTRKKSKRRKNLFVNLEADVASDVTVSEDEESNSSQNVLEDSFVNDETQYFGNTTNLQAHYMKTVRSPVSHRGFKIPQLAPKVNLNVFSQEVENEMDNTYLEDSFCVDSEEIDLTQNDVSELEIAEMLLNERKKKNKQLCDKRSKTKRKRIICVLSDSDSS